MFKRSNSFTISHTFTFPAQYIAEYRLVKVDSKQLEFA